jgi:uncharacterized protein YqeY
MMSLKKRIAEDMKTALKARETVRLSAIRMLHAEIRKREVDTRTELDDPDVLAILEKMVKQRKESLSHYEAAKRADLADVERTEIGKLMGILKAQLANKADMALVSKLVKARLG